MTKRILASNGQIPDAQSMPIAVRAFVPPPINKDAYAHPRQRKLQRRDSSEWTLTFDTETTTDAAQSLRFGAYQLRKGEELSEKGAFYDPDMLSAEEVALLRTYAATAGLRFLTRDEFVDEVFYGIAYQFRATIVGFNLPFDLSRLAIRQGSARGPTMRGGFTFQLSRKRWWPNVQVKHLSARNALIQFTKAPRWAETRGERKRSGKRPTRRGAFVDIKTLAAALLSRSFNLGSLAELLGVPNLKQSVEKHGGPLTESYIAYGVNDVQSTWECYCALLKKLQDHQLTETSPGKILSEASIGKAYLKQMGIQPFREIQPDFPAALTGKILTAYLGGRTEVRWRRNVKQVLYCDFLSMYPTVCILMGLWQFVIAKGVTWRDSTVETQSLLDRVSLADLQRSELWQNLTTLVRGKPDADIFPVRAKYDGASQTIGLNFLTSETPLWFTLADTIAAKLLTGKTPQIVEAIAFAPGEPQGGLRPIAIAGKPEYAIDPRTADFFKRVIDLRTVIKAKLATAEGVERDRLEAEQLALKILANATSYGIFVEINVGELDRPETRACFGPKGESFSVETDKSEERGKYFHPLLATLITGAARLMLATAERLVIDAGLDWAFCDTDSMAIAKPDGMEQVEFFAAAITVCEWFAALNPYENKGPLFKIEDVNFSLTKTGGAKQLQQLYCYSVSSKRYVLFNLSVDGEPIIRKASAHGLGHLIAPYAEADAPTSIPAPALPLSEIGVERWQYDLWYMIVSAALAGHPDQIDLSYHPALDQPAASRYGATTPELLRWFKRYNQNSREADQVKPFNFMVSFQHQSQLVEPEIVLGSPKRGRKPKAHALKPIAPYDKDPAKASRNAFDRETGKPVPVEELKTYRQALAGYHLSPEAKFLNGDYFDRGRTERRHVIAEQILHIGKEANKWEEQHFLGEDEDAEIEYGADPGESDLDNRLRSLMRDLGERRAAVQLRISRTALRNVAKAGVASSSRFVRKRIVNGLGNARSAIDIKVR